MSIPTFEDLLPVESNELKGLRNATLRSGYNLLREINSRATEDKWLQIATSESLTAGLIMATLVDIPWAGYVKYGCFGVYDTDAKRVFNGVTVDDVYTHKCAKEMAIGTLKNSNATIALAVTGNAMPYANNADKLGEVFIGIAGYKNNEIIYETHSINGCIESDIDGFKKLCYVWYKTIMANKFNQRTDTALLSQEIRYYTAMKAMELCENFIKNNEPEVPVIVLTRKETNNIKEMSDESHINIPDNKYPADFGSERCVRVNCDNAATGKRVDAKPFTPIGGSKKSKRNRVHKHKKTRRMK